MSEYPDEIRGFLREGQDAITYVLVTRRGEPININEWLARQEKFHNCMVEISIKLYTK